MKLRERQYQSKFDRRHNAQRRIVPESELPPIDFRRALFKWGPWVVMAAIGYAVLDAFVF